MAPVCGGVSTFDEGGVPRLRSSRRANARMVLPADGLETPEPVQYGEDHPGQLSVRRHRFRREVVLLASPIRLVQALRWRRSPAENPVRVITHGQDSVRAE